ncbi:MAG: sugar kinase [Phycisphaerae bacterium]|nr:sugar kinase [Phycisphaerae bacterium]
MGFDLVTFGECMVRLAAPDRMRLEQARHLEVTAAGAEWNVAVNVARLGHRTAWASRLVDNWVGRFIAGEARTHGVDTSQVVWTEFDGIGKVRNGLYFLEHGAGPRASNVVYDRAYSAISGMSFDMVDWKSLLSQTRWLHGTGITPALSETVAETTVKVFRMAAEMGVTTSYDLNFRSKLWPSKRAIEVNSQIAPYISVMIGNEEDFEKALGVKAAGIDQNYAKLDPASYEPVAVEVKKKFPNIQWIGTTLRDAKTGLLNDWRVILYDGTRLYTSKAYENLEIVDRLGGGDSFASAVIASFLEGRQDGQEIAEFAGAYSALAHTFPGDMNWATREEAAKAAKGASARVSR